MQKKIPTLLLVLLFLLSCKNDLSDVEKFTPREDAFLETAHDVRLLYSDSAVVKVQVEGPKMVRYLDKEEPRDEFPGGIAVSFFDGRQRVNSTLTSKFAVRYEGKKQITVSDSVVWISKQGEMLETELLIWDEENEKVYSNRFVRITDDQEVIYGHGFEANQDFTEWRIKQIEGRMKLQE
ncbi:MAG: LPS export ABC transporter periplasmic protein LptC [Saprospiraceae bacterium]